MVSTINNKENETLHMKSTRKNLPNQSHQTKSTKPNLPDKTYQTKPYQMLQSVIILAPKNKFIN